jgi:exopolyphosphatase/guanosine-5'-triphosphate,3'-diphosphate pyrophosphatase
MFAAVDLGSNSFRLAVGHHDGTTIELLKTAREPIRLAAGLDGAGNLSEAAQQRALACLRGFRTLLAGYELDAVRVVATSTLRQARNGAAFLPQAEQAIGHPIEIISGEEEGRLIYMGVANALAALAAPGAPAEARLVLDIGGGSTELILGRALEIERVESFTVGTVRQSLSFFVGGRIDAVSFDAAILSARSQFEDGAPPFHAPRWKRAYGSSGTVRALADIMARNGIGDGTVNAASLDALKARFLAFGHLDRVELAGLRPERASTLVGGLAILIALVSELGIDTVHPVEAGLRLGVMWELFHRSQHRDRRDDSARALARRFHVDPGRADLVAANASALYAQFKAPAEATARLLFWSALLHETGMAVSQTGYHKHAAYLVENADLPGFTAREQAFMGRLLLAQKGNLRKVADRLVDTEFARAVLALRLAILLMHARIAAAPGAVRLRLKSRVELELRRDLLAGHPTLAYWIEKEQEWWDEVDIDFSFRTFA